MQKDWFPFFSMLFWLFTKLAGLGLFVIGLQVMITLFQIEFRFGTLLFGALTPMAMGGVLLVTEIVFDLATAEMKRRQAVAK